MLILTFIFFLLFLSAFFSGSETGLTGTDRAKIHKLKLEGDKKAQRVSKLLDDKDKLITTILLGNNLVNIAATSLATSLAISYYGDEGVFLVTAILTLVVLIFAEVLPKTYAIKNSEKVALLVATPFILITKILTPFTWFVDTLVKFFTKIFGMKNDEAMEDIMHGTDALKGAIEMHHEEGSVIKDDRDMLGSILELSETEVHEVMKHRKDMETIDISMSNEEIVNMVLKSQYTRIALYENNQDNIIGTIHTKTLMRTLNIECGGDYSKLDVRAIMTDPWFVPATTSLKEQLINFKEKHSHFALVVDEYGSLLGLITLEDILEEIVGNIEDEYDIEYHLIEEKTDGSFIVDGSIPIRDLNREMDWNLPSDDANTIAGLLINDAEIIPSEGQAFNFYDMRIEVLEKENNQIKKLKIQPMVSPIEQDEP
jgi:Mg2+/Co2+ transporter CorB